MALISPGIEVSVVDESQYASTAVGTVPMLVVATAQDKQDPTTGGTAGGTLAANAGKTYLIGSQRELVSTFGEPLFYQNSSGTALHGYELNEYGLMSAYSLLGVSNRAYVVRADVDLAELEGSAGRPNGAPSNGTHWLNISNTRWGIFEWNATTQQFENKTPIVITDSTMMDNGTGLPKLYIGKDGDYAIDATDITNPLFRKVSRNWVNVGTTEWYEAVPAVTGTEVNPTITIGHSISINGTTVTATGTTIDSLKDDINDESITGITATVEAGKLSIHVDSTATNEAAVILNVSGDILTNIGISADTYYAPAVATENHTSVPQWKSIDAQSRPSGSVWVKITNPNNGASFDLSQYSSAFENFISLDVNCYQGQRFAIYDLDPVGGGLNIEAGTVYVAVRRLNDGEVAFELTQRIKKGTLEVIGLETSPSFTAFDQIIIRSSSKGTSTLTSTTVTLSGTTADTFVGDIMSANIPYVEAEVTDSGAIKIIHTLGGVIQLENVSGNSANPITAAGFVAGSEYITEGLGTDVIILSNFAQLVYVASTIRPTSNPLNGRLWYHNVTDEIDIMIHNGSDWKGYQTLTNLSPDARGYDLSLTNPTGPFVSASEPVEQSDGTSLVLGDLWLDTSDLENFPVIKRYELVDGENKWVTLDNTDQTSENGILFADARYTGDGTTDVTSGSITSIVDLLTNDYVDLDAPNPSNYPRGMLLFNTRRSSYNVKQFRRNYFNATDFADQVLPTEKDAWVSVAGLKNDGSPFMGRKAVRQVVVEAMKSAIDTSAELREEQRGFNIISAPGYPELLQNMVALNNDRRNTAFVVGDTPFRLAANSTDIQNWANNVNLATDNGDEGLVSADPYMAVFYPHGIATDLDGNSIMVPASHMILRTIIRSDDASYPWFAPAGTRRGVVDNATGLGYLDVATGEFISTGVRESLRDTLYENAINPVAFFPGNGILNYGNKTRTATASALDRINVARLTAYIRERLAVITKPFVFEPNDKLTRDEVKQVVEQLMNDLVAKRGLYDYLVVCDETNNTPDRIDRNELYIDIAIEPVKAVEYIYIPVRIQNTGSI